MSHSGNSRHSVLSHLVRIALVLLVLFALAGCALVRVLGGGGVRLNDLVEGELTYSDDTGSYTGGLFYIDSYTVRLKAAKSYSAEFWCEPGIPMHLNCWMIDEDMTTRYDSADFDGYLLFEFPEEFPAKFGFSVYLRSDFMDEPTWYRFRINEQ
jgi:hypothetical protein